MRLLYILLLGVLVAVFLWLRTCIDRGREKLLDTDVVREDEEHLGAWASSTKIGSIYFRLRRDGRFYYHFVKNESKDTFRVNGRYEIIGGNSPNNYPRLVTIDEKNDTLFNFFIGYITPYDSKVDKVDRMVLSPGGIYDTLSYRFYRVKPINELK